MASKPLRGEGSAVRDYFGVHLAGMLLFGTRARILLNFEVNSLGQPYAKAYPAARQAVSGFLSAAY